MGVFIASSENIIVNYSEFISETGIDEETSKELYEVFMEELLQEKEKLINRYSSQEYEKLGRTVHNIKGISASYKAHPVYEMARLIDMSIKVGEFDRIKNNFGELLNAIDNVVRDIKAHYSLQTS